MAQPQLVGALDALASAVADEDFEQIDAALDEYEAAYQASAPTERSRLQRSRLLRREADLSSSERSKLGEYERQRAATSAVRTSIFAGGDLLLLNPDSDVLAEYGDAIGELRSREQALNEKSGVAETVLSDFEVPASVAILSVSASTEAPVYGATTTVETTVENVGDETATGVTLQAESGLPVNPTEQTLGSLADERSTVTFEVTAAEAGDHDVNVTVESENAGSTSGTATISVLTKRDLAETASESIGELITRIKEAEDVPDNKAKSLVTKLERADDSIDRAIRAIGRGKRKRADNALGTAINQLGAFLNDFASSKGGSGKGKNGKNGSNSPSATVVQSVERSAHAIIDQLARARDAAIAN